MTTTSIVNATETRHLQSTRKQGHPNLLWTPIVLQKNFTFTMAGANHPSTYIVSLRDVGHEFSFRLTISGLEIASIELEIIHH